MFSKGTVANKIHFAIPYNIKCWCPKCRCPNYSELLNQQKKNRELVNIAAEGSDEGEEKPTQAEIQPLMLRFNENPEPVLVYDDQD